LKKGHRSEVQMSLM